MSSGIVQRRKNQNTDDTNNNDNSQQDETDEEVPLLTLMEEVLLLGLKDNEGLLSFWNDNISYVLRGIILIELSFRNRISAVKDPRKQSYSERIIEVKDDTMTGEVLLDETLRFMKTDSNSIAVWIDLLSGLGF